MAVPDRGHEVGGTGGPARGDHRDMDAGRDRGQQFRVEAVPGAVAVHRRHEQLARSEFHGSLRPGDGFEVGPHATAMRHHFPGRWGALRAWQAARVDRADDRLAAEPVGALAQQLGAGHGRGHERDLIRARSQDVPHLLDAAHAATDGEWHECPPGGPADGVEHGATSLVRGGDVEEDDLIGALVRVSLGQLGRIALVSQVDEPGPLDDTTSIDVQARDDASGEHQRALARGLPATMRRKLASSLIPTAADFSGWNWTP